MCNRSHASPHICAYFKRQSDWGKKKSVTGITFIGLHQLSEINVHYNGVCERGSTIHLVLVNK